MDGRSTRWEGHADAQRARVVAAAIELIEAGDHAPSLAEIGRHAGLARSAVYRHFADKAALDAAVRRRIFHDLADDLLPKLELTGSPAEAWRRVLQTYVDWAADHPRLHRHAVLDPENGPLQAGLDEIARRIAAGVIAWFESLGVVVTEADRLTTDPLVHGLVSGVFGAVRRWVELGAKVPNRAQLVERIVEATAAIIDARMTAYGVDVSMLTV